MALSAREFEKALPQALLGKRVIILSGDNFQVKSDLFRAVRKSLGVAADDPFRLVLLDSETLSADPARLADELGAISMFGGSRVIRAGATPRRAEEMIEVARAAPTGDWLLVLDADEFTPSSQLGQDVVLVHCASETAGDFRTFVRAEFERAGVALGEGVLDALIPLLGEDRSAARGEVEKLALVATAGEPVTLEDLRSVVSDGSTLLADEIAVAALSGDLAAVSAALNRLGSAGSDAPAAVGSASRLVLNLFRARASQWKGRPDQPLQTLTTDQLRQVVRSVQAAVLQTRTDGSNSALLAERALMSLANSVRSRRR